MALVHIEKPKLFTVNGQHFILVAGGRGEELQIHLEAHGVPSRLSREGPVPLERLDLAGDVDRDAVQAILDHWEG